MPEEQKNSVEARHDQYTEFFPKWVKARAVIAGEDAIRAGREIYLDKLDGQTDPEYKAYMNRAIFFNATSRTADGLAGMVFRAPPTLVIDKGLDKIFEPILKDFNMRGISFNAYAKDLCEEVLEVGRAGTLVDWEGTENRAYACKYEAESITNWRVERINGQMMLTLVVLCEEGYPIGADGKEVKPDETWDAEFVPECVEQYRVLRLVPKGQVSGTKVTEYEYIVELWQPVADKSEDKKFVKVATLTPTRKAKPLPAIPFVFHGAKNSLPDIDRLPLEDLINLNLHHFRLSADYNHGLHFTALPTAWISGFPKETTYKIGSSVAWVSDNPGASAGYLEFTGQGLDSFVKALDRDEKLMAVIGARLLAPKDKQAETAQAMEIRASGEGATLMNIALAGGDALTKILQWVYWWNTTEDKPEEVPADKILCTLNTDFIAVRLDAAELLALVKARQAGLISEDTFLHNMKAGEVLPPGVSIDDEKDLIKLTLPPTPQPAPKPAAA